MEVANFCAAMDTLIDQDVYKPAVNIFPFLAYKQGVLRFSTRDLVRSRVYYSRTGP